MIETYYNLKNSKGNIPMAQAKKTFPVFERYAIFQTGGKQYQAIEGKTIAIEKLEGNQGDTVEFKEVLLRKTGEDALEIGKPFVESSIIKASIVKQMRGPKIVVFKFKRRKKSRVKKGHRQSITVIRVESI
jgi:large subunit ribosomal protein L21